MLSTVKSILLIKDQLFFTIVRNTSHVRTLKPENYLYIDFSEVGQKFAKYI